MEHSIGSRLAPGRSFRYTVVCGHYRVCRAGRAGGRLAIVRAVEVPNTYSVLTRRPCLSRREVDNLQSQAIVVHQELIISDGGKSKHL